MNQTTVQTMPTTIQSAFRTCLVAGVAWAVGAGKIPQGDYTQLIEAVLLIGSPLGAIVWSHWNQRGLLQATPPIDGGAR